MGKVFDEIYCVDKGIYGFGRLDKKLNFARKVISRELPYLNRILNVEFPLENIFICPEYSKKVHTGMGLYTPCENSIILYVPAILEYGIDVDSTVWFNLDDMVKGEPYEDDMVIAHYYTLFAKKIIHVLAHELRHYKQDVEGTLSEVSKDESEKDAETFAARHICNKCKVYNHRYLLPFCRLIGINKAAITRMQAIYGNIVDDNCSSIISHCRHGKFNFQSYI